MREDGGAAVADERGASVSDATPVPATADLGPQPRAFSLRAIVIGVVLTAAFAVLTPINDWVVGNTYVYCHYLPPGVLLVVLGFALALNPLLDSRPVQRLLGSPLLGKLRFPLGGRLRPGEMAVIVAMLLGLGGTISNGFARLWIQITTGPAKILPSRSDLGALAPRGEPVRLPHGFFIGVPPDRALDASDAEHRYVIDGFYDGLPKIVRVDHRGLVTWRDAQGVERTQLALSGVVARRAAPGTFLDLDHEPGRSLIGRQPGQIVDTPQGSATVVAVEPAGIPWGTWAAAFLRWLPLVGGSVIACVAIAAIVRDQWIENERLPYPITAFFSGFMEPPHPGRRLPPVLREKAFWIGVAVATVWLGSQGLDKIFGLGFAIPSEINVMDAVRSPTVVQMYQWWSVFVPHLYLSIASLTFFLPLDLSFSLWAFYIGLNILCMLVRPRGIALSEDQVVQGAVGGYAVEILLILWVGRGHYWGAIKAAFGRDPKRRALAPYVWALFLSVAAMGATLAAAGARIDEALLAVVVYLGFVLVLARIVAEAGIPFVQTPTGWFVSQVVFSITGFNASATTLAPLTLIGAGLMPDSRENMLPYAVEAQYLGHRFGAPRRWLSASMVCAGLAGAVAGIAVLVYVYYRREHWVDVWPHMTLMGNNLEPLAQGLEGHNAPIRDTWACYGVGALVVGVVGVGRLLFAWWPLHPIGALIVASFCTYRIWFSFFVGWAWKLGVMRYGGTGVYQRLKPFAAGLIAGEAMMTFTCLVVGVARFLLHLPKADLPRFLPG